MLADEIRICSKCSLCSNIPEGFSPVPGQGSGKLFIVVDRVTSDDVVAGEILSGLEGNLLNNVLPDCFKKTFVTALVKCPGDPTSEAISSCKVWLWKEMQEVRPTVIVTMGRLSTATILGRQLKKTFKMKDVTNKRFLLETTIGGLTIFPSYSLDYVLKRGKKDVEYLRSRFKEAQDAMISLDGSEK